MVEQSSEERFEMKEEMECAFTPKRFQYLRRSDRGHPALR
jgi:hypothetical protein